MLIDDTYFVGQLNIPDTDDNTILERLNFFINKYEIEILRDALGMDLYRPFMTALGQSKTGYSNVVNGAANPATVDQKWIDLLNGKEYVGLDGRTHKWEGFIAVQDDTSSPKSILANFVYYWWMRDRVSQTMSTTEVVPQANNAFNGTPNDKAIRAWNEMCEWLRQMLWFLDYSVATNPDYYPGWWLVNRYRLLSRYAPINNMGF